MQANTLNSLRIMHNEIFEVAFFTSLLYNITEGVSGYKEDSYAPLTKKEAIKIIDTIKNQEEVHAVAVNATLKNAGQTAIAPCQYNFPVTTFHEAIALANLFTDVVLGTLPQAQVQFAADAGDESPLVPLFGSVIYQEGEQTGFYRLAQKKTPSVAPFPTGGAPPFAWTAVQEYIVPDSCPQPLSIVKLPTLGKLNVVTPKPTPKTKTLEFSIPAGDIREGKYFPEYPSIFLGCWANSIVYLSGQNVPLTVQISDVVNANGKTNFRAGFPFSSGFANGLTIAALVKGTGNFSSAADVAAVTVNGPGLIEIDELT
ncbi:MAG: hypothetical protein Q9167_006528 [Letrouitia subvulpina]